MPDVTVAIIGSGFGGIGMATRLRRAGITDVVLLERAADLGGTWRDNSYPGAACDVPSHLYSFSFAPNPGWTRSFSPQPEIWEYLRRVAADEGVTEKIRFGAEVTAARWDEAARVWRVETAESTLTARFLVTATGPLSDPLIPDIPGLGAFEGSVFHSAAWDHEYDLTGRNVAVIGTGASAIQFVPQIQPLVNNLTVFQRTPPWIIPRHDRQISQLERWLFRHAPVTQQVARAGIYWGREAYALGFVKNPDIMRKAEALALHHLRHQVSDPDLRARLTPSYLMGCKRILISNDYYPALTQPNVSLVTEGIKEIREKSVVTSDGTAYDADTLIFGTGFHVTDFPVAQRIFDSDGVSLAHRWSAEPAQTAFRGTTIARFPNLFVLTGPNTGLGHTSQVFMIEAQIRYVVSALAHARRHQINRIEVRAAAQAAYDRMVQRKMGRTVWLTGGCKSWYLDERGRNLALWPDFTWVYAWQTRRFDPASYDLTQLPLAGASHLPVVAAQRILQRLDRGEAGNPVKFLLGAGGIHDRRMAGRFHPLRERRKEWQGGDGPGGGLRQAGRNGYRDHAEFARERARGDHPVGSDVVGTGRAGGDDASQQRLAHIVFVHELHRNVRRRHQEGNPAGPPDHRTGQCPERAARQALPADDMRS
jgi:cation diffusion facilitator CzcD-associated flavoprotein CzcO